MEECTLLVQDTFGLERIGGQGSCKICGDLLSYRFAFKRWAVRNQLISGMRGGPLIKGSRDYVTTPPDSCRDHSLDFLVRFASRQNEHDFML